MKHRMREPMRLKRVKPLEIEQRLHHPQAGGVTVGDRDEIGAERGPDAGITRDQVVELLPDQHAGQIGVGEALGDALGDGVFERIVVENRSYEEGGERGIAPQRLLRFDANALKQRIGRECDELGGRLHNSLSPPKRRPDPAGALKER